MKHYFMKTERIGFSTWKRTDIELARQLWGDKEVAQYIYIKGIATDADIRERLKTEIKYQEKFGVQ